MLKSVVPSVPSFGFVEIIHVYMKQPNSDTSHRIALFLNDMHTIMHTVKVLYAI